MVNTFQLDRQQGDAPFNMAQLFYFRLNELLSLKSRSKICGDLEGWYSALAEIHTQISFKLNEKQNKKIIGDLQKIRKYLNTPMPVNKKAAAQLCGIVGNRVTAWLDDLDREMMHFMDVHKMIFPRIETRMPMDKLRDDYGIGRREG